MKLEAGGKELVLEVRIRNIRRLDRLYVEEIEEMAGMRVGLGAFIAVNFISIGDIGAIADVTRALSKEEESIEFVEDFIEEYAIENGMNDFVEKIEDILGKSPLLSDTFRNLEKKAELEKK